MYVCKSQPSYEYNISFSLYVFFFFLFFSVFSFFFPFAFNQRKRSVINGPACVDAGWTFLPRRLFSLSLCLPAPHASSPRSFRQTQREIRAALRALLFITTIYFFPFLSFMFLILYFYLRFLFSFFLFFLFLFNLLPFIFCMFFFLRFLLLFSRFLFPISPFTLLFLLLYFFSFLFLSSPFSRFLFLLGCLFPPQSFSFISSSVLSSSSPDRQTDRRWK